MPLELPPPPRQLRWRPDTGCAPLGVRWFLRLFTAPHCLIGIWLIFTIVYTPLVLLFGDDIPGRIVQRQTYQSKGKTHYQITYSYAVGEVEYRRELSVSEGQYASLDEGRLFPVRVFATFPTMQPQPLGPDNPWQNVLGLLAMAMFWNGVMSIVVWLAWIAPWRRRQLLKHGDAVAGRIVSKEERKVKGTTYLVHYEFVAPATERDFPLTRKQYLGKMEVQPDDFKAVQEGQTVTIIHDRRKPKRSLVYDFAEYKAVW